MPRCLLVCWVLGASMITPACIGRPVVDLTRHGQETPLNPAPPEAWSIRYDATRLTLLRGRSMVPLEPTWAPEVEVAFSVDALPPGLGIDATTGVISGTPNAIADQTVTITAASELGTVSFEVAVRVLDGFVVDTTDDVAAAGPANDGVCATAGKCSVRAALAEAAGTPGDQVVVVPPGTYRLSSGTLTQTGGALVGAGAGATIIDAAGVGRAVVVSGAAFMASLSIQHGTFDSDADQWGGCIVVRQSASLVMTSAIVQGCSGRYGGAVGLEPAATFDAEYTRFLDNHASANGGAIDATGDTTLQVRDSVFSHNVSGRRGGAVLAAGPVALFAGVLFDSNQAVNFGGGLTIEDHATATVRNCTFFNNSVTLAGGAVRSIGTIDIAFTTIAYNVATNDVGHGLSFEGGTATLQGLLLVANGGGAACNDTTGAVTSLGSNVTDAASCAFFDAATDVVGTQRAGLATTLADNGGPTLTLALDATSAAIDIGGADECAPADQRGVARPVAGTLSGPVLCDAGAFERAP